jgi:hypothetical protein
MSKMKLTETKIKHSGALGQGGGLTFAAGWKGNSICGALRNHASASLCRFIQSVFHLESSVRYRSAEGSKGLCGVVQSSVIT